MFVLTTLGCAAGDLFARPTPTPVPTRVAAPTFTMTPDFMQGLVVVTPPSQGTPGVIIIPPGVDPRSVIPIPETPTFTVTPTPTPAPPTSTSLPTDAPTSTPSATLTDVATTVVTTVATTIVTTIVTNGLTITSPVSLPVSVSVGVTVEQNVPVESTPTPIAVLFPQPSATPSAFDSPILLPTITPSLVPTATPIPLPTGTPTVTPTPFVLVTTGLVSLRTGPGPEFPLVAQLGPNIPVAIVGQNPEGTWYEICCVNGGSVWVAQSHVQTINDTSGVGLVLAGPAPTATATGTPTSTPTITPTPSSTPYGFQVVEGPLYFPSGNELLTIWAKISAGGGQVPLPGYYVKVVFRNRADGSSFEDRPNTRGEAPSADFFEFNVAPGPGSGNRVQFNYKFEFLPPDPKAEDSSSTLTRASLMDGYWRIYVVDGSGKQLSDAIQFDTLAGNINREIFVSWSLNQ